MKIQRYSGNVLSPATNAQGQERTLFGSQSQGDDLDSNLNASLLRGWGIVGPNEFPTLEDFNAAMYTLGQFIAYLHQMGLPEWHTDQEFHTGSLTLRSGAIYVSQGDDNTGNDPATDDGTNWMGLPALSIAYDNTDSSLTAENVKAALDELDTVIQNLNAADIAYDNSDSTLTSGNTKDALDELDGKVEGFNEPGTVIDTQTFSSPGSFTWNKPSEANADDTVVARIWGGGASGSAQEDLATGSFKSGGQGGAFVEVSFRATNTPSSATVNVGAGGSSVSASGGTVTAGQDGGDSDVFGFTAKGGDASEDGSGLSQNGFTDDVTLIEWLRDLWAGGLPGPSGSDRDGSNAFYGGAGGASVADAAEGSGGVSRYAGNGGDSDHVSGGTATAGDGQSPGGGGGAALVTDDGSTAISGAGGDGLVEIYVIRGWSPSGITADIT